MKHSLVSSAGTDRVRALINSMRNLLLCSLLSRFVPPFITIRSASRLASLRITCCFPSIPIDPAALISSSVFRLSRVNPLKRYPQGHDPLTFTCYQCRSGFDSFTVAGYPLTVIACGELN